MSRAVHTTPEVVELVGSEQLARHSEPGRTGPVQCWRCGHAVAADQDVALSVLRVLDPEAPAGAGAVSYVVHSHPTCGASMVLELTPAQLAQLRELWRAADGDATGIDDLDVRVAVGGTSEQPYPLVLVSFRADMTVEQPGPDRVDLVATVLTEAGWQPVFTLVTPPAPGPHGYRLRFHAETDDGNASGLLEVLGPDGVETAATVEPTQLWRQLVHHHGWAVLVQGSNYLNAGQEGVERAVRSGLLVGGRVPVDLDGPGNAEAVRR